MPYQIFTTTGQTLGPRTGAAVGLVSVAFCWRETLDDYKYIVILERQLSYVIKSREHTVENYAYLYTRRTKCNK